MATNSINQRWLLLKRLFYLFFTIGVTVWVFAYLFSIISIDDVVNAVKKSSLYYLLLFFLFSMVMSIGRTWRYILFLNVSGHQPGHLAMFLVTLARNFFSDLLPARLGTLVYIYLTQTRLGISFDAAASSFALSFLFDIIVLVLMVMSASLFISSTLISSGVMIAISLLLLVICIAILIWLPSGLHWTGDMIAKISKLPLGIRTKCKEGLIATGREINQIKKQGIYPRVIALSVIVRLGKYLALYALLLAIVVPLGFKVAAFPFTKVFFGLCGAELSASLPISGIAGFGAYEGAWALIFQMLGYEAKLSVLTSVTHHLISQIYGYLLGAAALLTLLLPIFKRKTRESIRPTTIKANGFWPRYALMITIIGVLFFGAISSPYADKHANGTQSNKINTSPQVPSNQMPKGRVVYMKSDGIYVKELNSGNEKRVLENATYPRWSPDGEKITFVREHQIGMINLTNNEVVFLATAANPRAVVFHDTGNSILYTDGDKIFSVDIHSRQITTVTQGKTYKELDVAKKGSLLAVTAKEKFGYYVYVIDLVRDQVDKIARGCSASLAPQGDTVTVNGRKHLRLKLYDRLTGDRNGVLDAPSGHKFDNQFWSNHPDWIASVSDGDRTDVFIHQVSTNQSWQVTNSGDCDRPDLYVEQKS